MPGFNRDKFSEFGYSSVLLESFNVISKGLQFVLFFYHFFHNASEYSGCDQQLRGPILFHELIMHTLAGNCLSLLTYYVWRFSIFNCQKQFFRLPLGIKNCTDIASYYLSYKNSFCLNHFRQYPNTEFAA